MKRSLPGAGFTISRRRFMEKLAGASAALAGPSLLWGTARQQLPHSEAGQPQTALPWSVKPAPLLTPWSSQVDAQMPHPLYPRPQLVREAWLNLNGLWEFQPGTAADEEPPFGKSLSGAILVPYPVESALSGVMEHHERLWYRRTLTVPAAWRGKRILLHFGAVDYESEVFVNGQRVGLHRGGYDPFSYDITSYLSGKDSNELIVRVYDPTENGGQPRGKQCTKPHGIMYTPTTGIWQTVWLEPVASSFIKELTMVPDIDRAQLNLTITAENLQSNSTVDINAKSGDVMVTDLSAAPDETIVIPIPNQRLWSPNDPFLYTLEVTLKHADKIVDTITSYFGMRKTHVGIVNGQKKLLLNNEFVFQLGPLDQGFWPDGIYTPPTDEAMKNDIMQMKAMGFNMVRKHIKVEPARWYYWTDTLGLLVWQDMPSADSYPGREFVPPPVDKNEFESELRRMIETHKNSPSIALWTIFNEGQGQFDAGHLVNVVRSLDSSRPVNEASGGKIEGFGDLDDIHSYPEPAVRPSNGRQAMVCGEFGGIGYLIAGHSWEKRGGGYIEVDTNPDMLYLYAEFMDWVQRLRDQNNLSASVYTQLTDVMTEVNGLMTYDRVAKIPSSQLNLVNTFRFAAPSYTNIVPTSEAERQIWKYVFTRPEGPWWNQDYDDSHWLQGAGPFGSTGSYIGTRWTSPDLWLRRHFNPRVLTPDQLEHLVVTGVFEGRFQIYINGAGTYPQRGANRSGEIRYEHRPIQRSVREAIRSNSDNVIAIHCLRNGDKQYFDAGLSIRMQSKSLS